MKAFLIAWDDLTVVGNLGISIHNVKHFARSVGSFCSKSLVVVVERVMGCNSNCIRWRWPPGVEYRG